MRLATWNLERPSSATCARALRQAEWFERIDAEIWVLTESRPDLSPGQGFQGVYSTPLNDGQVWASVWSRYPLEPLAPTLDAEFSVAARVAPPGGPPLVVYGTVLPWLGRGWRGLPSAGGVAFAAALEAQRRDWEELRGQHPDHELVVAGDFNQDLAERHYYGSRRNRLALEEAFSSVGLRCLSAGSADPVWCKTQGRRASIDHLCLGDGLGLRALSRPRCWPDSGTPDRALSDHVGLVADVAVRPS